MRGFAFPSGNSCPGRGCRSGWDITKLWPLPDGLVSELSRGRCRGVPLVAVAMVIASASRVEGGGGGRSRAGRAWARDESSECAPATRRYARQCDGRRRAATTHVDRKRRIRYAAAACSNAVEVCVVSRRAGADQTDAARRRGQQRDDQQRLRDSGMDVGRDWPGARRVVTFDRHALPAAASRCCQMRDTPRHRRLSGRRAMSARWAWAEGGRGIIIYMTSSPPDRGWWTGISNVLPHRLPARC